MDPRMLSKAALKDSFELRDHMEAWGLGGEFKAAQMAETTGQFNYNDSIRIEIEAGSYIAVLSNGTVVIGENPEETAQQAFQYGITALRH